MKLRVGEPVDLQAGKRYIQHVRDHAIGDVCDALGDDLVRSRDFASYNEQSQCEIEAICPSSVRLAALSSSPA